MSDHSITIVPKKSVYPDNEAAAKKMIAWLISRDIIKQETSDCILATTHGYAISEGARKIVQEPESLPFSLTVTGLEVITERTIFHTGENGLDEMICPACKQNITAEEWSFFDKWFNDTNDKIVCPLCEAENSIHSFAFTPQWGFSNLGFTFWNWPGFTGEFVESFAEQLGSEVDVVYTWI